MTTSLPRRKVLGTTIALLALFAGPAILFGPRIVRAFTLIPNVVYFDAVSVPTGHTLHVHVVNRFGSTPMIFRFSIQPTSPATGTPVTAGPVTLNPGEGTEQTFSFAGFSPPGGVTRVPVTSLILVEAPSGTTLSSDWSGQVASSVEIVDDATDLPTAILGGRHIVRSNPGGVPTFCLSCN